MEIGGSKNSIVGWYRSHPVVFFVLSFAIMMIAFYSVYLSPWAQDKIFTHVLNIYAELSSVILHMIGYQTSAQGQGISSSQFSVDIRMGCDAMEAMAMFMGGIIAFPSSLRKKITGLVAGVFILFIINVVRIISLFIAGAHNHSLFETLHVAVWPIIFILIPIGLWFAWIQWTLTASGKK